MTRISGGVGVSLVVLACVLLVPAPAGAQLASGIAGVVRDTSGAVLPGVTVEASSPVLIEKVRTVVTDGEGRYSIVDLRPGAYTVAFTLTGFSTVKREGIDLPGGFTATVNADLKVGALEETITVSGAAPLVDVQNVKRAAAATDTLLQSLPSGTRTFGTLAAIVPGLLYQKGASTTGTKGIGIMTQTHTTTFHGKFGALQKFDGFGTDSNTNGGLGGYGYVPNGYAAQEMRVETGGISLESNTANIAFDLIPKEGSNTFETLFYGHYTGGSLQGNNLTDALRARGLTTVPQVDYIVDTAATIGGPLKQNRLWFFTAHRGMATKNFVPGNFFNKTLGTPLYTPDLSRPAFSYDWLRSNNLRLTWQVSPKNKLNIFGDNQTQCACRLVTGAGAPEVASNHQFNPQGLYQVTWNFPPTNRVLFEGGGSAMVTAWNNFRHDGTTTNDIATTNIQSGYRYNANTNYGSRHTTKIATRFSASYVTGSHAFKTGFYLENGRHFAEYENNGGLSYSLLGATPVSVTQFAYPFIDRYLEKGNLGVYAQDQWTVKRLTLNLGAKFDYFNVMIKAQDDLAGAWVPARHYDPIYQVPLWKNINPRVGGSYDLFGNGRTALKASLGRYNGPTGSGVYALAGGINAHQTAVSQVTRTWNDANQNYVPDCVLSNFLANGECGQISDLNFGKQNPGATRVADDVTRGWGVRDYMWDVTTEVQHQLTAGLSVTAGYYHSSFGNFTAIDNLDVTAADFSPYCITAPKTAANGSFLPGGGGYQVCGLYDVSPAKFGKVTNLVTQASHYGKQTNKSDFIGLNFNGRFGRGIQLGGGLDTGRTAVDRCFVVDSPQELQYCHVVTPFRGQTQVKLFGSIPLPADIVVSGSFQNYSGPVNLAQYAASNAEIAPSLGRNLAACGTRVVCTATTVGIPLPQIDPARAGVEWRTAANGIPLIEPFTEYSPRVTQLDLRLSKIVKLGPKMRLQANVDLYNVLNGDGVQDQINTFGSRWLLPTQVQDPRMIMVGGQLTF